MAPPQTIPGARDAASLSSSPSRQHGHGHGPGAHHQHAQSQQFHYNAYHHPEPPILSPASGGFYNGGTPSGSGAPSPSGYGGLPTIPVDPSTSSAAQAAAKKSLKEWWGKFTKQQEKERGNGGSSSGAKSETSPTNSTFTAGGLGGGRLVFGVPLTESLKYAGVAISMVGSDGVSQVYG